MQPLLPTPPLLVVGERETICLVSLKFIENTPTRIGPIWAC